MNSLSTGPVRRWRRFAGLFALLLVLASVSPSHASAGGVVNGSFDTREGCSLANWTGSGSWSTGVAALTNNWELQSCAGKISAMAGIAESSIEGPDQIIQPFLEPNTTTLTVSTIEQRFIVNPANPKLLFYVKPESDNTWSSYPAQTIALYNSAGQLITQTSRNLNAPSDVQAYAYSYNLSAYANQYVTLRLTVQIDTADPSSPTIARMLIDFDCPVTKGCAGNPEGGTLGGFSR